MTGNPLVVFGDLDAWVEALPGLTPDEALVTAEGVVDFPPAVLRLVGEVQMRPEVGPVYMDDPPEGWDNGEGPFSEECDDTPARRFWKFTRSDLSEDDLR